MSMPFGFGTKIAHKGLILVAVPLIFEIFFVAVMTKLHADAEIELERQAHSRAVIYHANDVMRRLLDAATAAGAYNLTHKKHYAEQFDQSMSRIDDEFTELESLVADNPRQLANIQEIRQSSKDVIVLLVRLRNWHDEHKGLGLIIGQTEKFGAVRPYVEKLSQDLENFTAEERAIDAESPALQTQNRRRIVWGLLVGIALNIVLAVAMAVYFARGIAGRLRVLADNTVRVTKHDQLLPPLSGGDEIAVVDVFFRRMLDRLHEVDEMKRQIVSMVSHDLRTPLTSVQGTLSLLESGALGELNEKAHVQVEKAEANVGRLIGLINDLLDVEKMEAGQLEMHSTDVAVSSIIEKSVEAVAQFAADHEVLLCVAPTLLGVHADEQRLMQVLVNLLSNAVKFSAAGSRVDIESRAVEDNMVEIAVIDRGRGIPADQLDSVFDRFKQVDTADGARGSGLGLAIVKMIVAQLGGTITAESQVGVGTTMRVCVPQAKALVYATSQKSMI